MSRSTVALVRCDSYDEAAVFAAAEKGVGLLGVRPLALFIHVLSACLRCLLATTVFVLPATAARAGVVALGLGIGVDRLSRRRKRFLICAGDLSLIILLSPFLLVVAF